MDRLFAALLQHAGGDAHADREQWHKRQQRGVGQRRRAHGTTVANETFADEQTEVSEAMRSRARKSFVGFNSFLLEKVPRRRADSRQSRKRLRAHGREKLG